MPQAITSTTIHDKTSNVIFYINSLIDMGQKLVCRPTYNGRIHNKNK